MSVTNITLRNAIDGTHASLHIEHYNSLVKADLDTIEVLARGLPVSDASKVVINNLNQRIFDNLQLVKSYTDQLLNSNFNYVDSLHESTVGTL